MFAIFYGQYLIFVNLIIGFSSIIIFLCIIIDEFVTILYAEFIGCLKPLWLPLKVAINIGMILFGTTSFLMIIVFVKPSSLIEFFSKPFIVKVD